MLMCFKLEMMGFILEMMGFILEMMDFILEMVDFILEMVEFQGDANDCTFLTDGRGRDLGENRSRFEYSVQSYLWSVNRRRVY